MCVCDKLVHAYAVCCTQCMCIILNVVTTHTGADCDGHEVLQPLVTEGLMSLYVDTLRTLRTLTARGGQVLPSLEDLVLRSLLTMVGASSGAQASVAAAGGLQVLIDSIGFPKAQAADPLPMAPSRSATAQAPPRVLRGAGTRPVEDELRVQLLSLQVLMCFIIFSGATMLPVDTACSARIPCCIVVLCMWDAHNTQPCV